MKRLYLFPLLCIIVLYSCKKDKATDSSCFNFKANGGQHSWGYNTIGPSRGATITRTTIPSPGYLLQAWDKAEGITVNLHLNTPTLSTGTFKTVTTSATITYSSYLINTATYAPFQISDSVSVTISGINNKHASGSFVATMHDISIVSNKIELSEGHFESVQIIE